MYWLCINDETHATAIVYSATDPMETSVFWDQTYAYESEAEAVESQDGYYEGR